MKKNIVSLIAFTIILALAGCGDKNANSRSPEELLRMLDIKIEKDNDNADLYFQRGSIFLQLGRVNEAIGDLNHAVTLDGDKKDYYKLLGDAYFANGNMGKSYEAFQNAQRLDPKGKDDEIPLKMGEIAFYSKDYDRAIDHLSVVTKKDPDNRTALFLKSFIYKEKGDTVSAITLLDKVCGLYPDYAPAFGELGSLYASHHSKLAEDYFLTALRLDPKDNNTRYGLAMYYQETNQFDKAEEQYKLMLDLDEGSADAWHNRGYIELFHFGDYELAIDYLSHAIACDSNHLAAIVNRGYAYSLAGRKKDAKADFERALRIDPSFQPAIDGMKSL